LECYLDVTLKGQLPTVQLQILTTIVSMLEESCWYGFKWI